MKLKSLFRRALLIALTRLNASSRKSGKVFHRGDKSTDCVISESFYLDETATFDITGTPDKDDIHRWMPVTHCDDKRTSVILVSGECFKLPDTLQIEEDTRLYLRYSAALPNISVDGLECEICFLETGQASGTGTICVLPVAGGAQAPSWRDVELDISFLAGRKGYLMFCCRPGPEGDPSADWLAISDLCVGRKDLMPILKARSFHELRSRNEIEHFSNVYRHSMYVTVQDQQAETASGISRSVRKLMQSNNEAEKIHTFSIGDIEPLQDESPFDYATRLLAEYIPQTPPDFLERLKSRAKSGEIIKVLSLCSGAARFEAEFSARVGTNVEWSLLDINVDLLGLASKQFSPSTKLDLIEGNANDLTYSGEKWDIILCISALHHIVELEKLLKFCHNSLYEDGEFWCIGEAVGRNGNRLWPDARVEANKIFQELPERYRVNSHTGQVDSEIPDNDYSVGCFEGIRSEEIESVLNRWFHQADVYHRNCFLWRLVNLAYSDNYDLQNPEDRMWLARMVSAEVNHFRAGGRGTELHGVYSPRLLSRELGLQTESTSTEVYGLG